LLDPLAQLPGCVLDRSVVGGGRWHRCLNHSVSRFWSRGSLTCRLYNYRRLRFIRPNFNCWLGGLLWRRLSFSRRRIGRAQVLLRSGFALHPQDALGNLPAAVFDDGWLPVRVRFLELLQQAARQAVFRQGPGKLIIPLQLFALLRRHVSLEKSFAWVVALRGCASDDKQQPCD